MSFVVRSLFRLHNKDGTITTMMESGNITHGIEREKEEKEKE